MHHGVEGIIQEVVAVLHWLLYSDWTQDHWNSTFNESYYCLLCMSIPATVIHGTFLNLIYLIVQINHQNKI